MYLSDIYTITANLAGIPGISIPCGLTHAKLPIGLQLLGSTVCRREVTASSAMFSSEDGLAFEAAIIGMKLMRGMTLTG